MEVGLLTRGLILAAYLFAMGAILRMAFRFVRNPEMVKAKIFLNYPRFSRRFLVLVGFAFAAEAFNYAYTMAGGYQEGIFESWAVFFQHQTITMAVAGAIGLGMIHLWRMSK
ncbi:MAG: hypothetical protein QXT68_08095 [Halobacteria archaeon]